MGARTRAGDYCRESKGKRSSIDDQDRENRAACDERDWDLVVRFRDSVSASRHARDERADWPRVTEYVASGQLDVLVVWEVSRADRDLETWVPFVATCRRLGVLIHVTSAETTYNPAIAAHWKTLIDDGVDAAYESDKISNRTLKGIRGAAEAGKQHGPPPYGLTRVYDQHDRRQFTQVPNERAVVVREIIERIAVEDPIILIERDLNNRGVPPPSWPGVPAALGLWRRNTIRNIARNPAYAGLRVYDKVTYLGNWDPLVDEDTWRAAQAVLDDESRKTTEPGSYRWMLSYVATGRCGGQLGGFRGRAGRRDRYHCRVDGCTMIGVWDLDEYVTRVVCGWFARKGARRLFESSDADATTARADLAELNDELEAARESYARPRGISEIALAMKEHALTPLIEDAQKRIVRATAPGAALKLLTAAETEESLIRPVWDGMSIAAHRSVIAALTEEIRVRPAGERLSRWSPEADRLRLAAGRTTIRWVSGARAVFDS